jgi:hypothetical protein
LDESIDLASLSSTPLECTSVGADKAANGARVVSSAVGQLGLAGVQYLVGEVMSNRRAVVAGLNDPAAAVEAALLATPLPMRLECSFTIGLKFALGRRYRLALIGDDMTAVKRTCRGQPIELVEKLGPGSVPATEPTRWVAMAGDCYEGGRLGGLVELAGRQFDDVSAQALDAIADRQVSLNHIGEASMGELLQTLLGEDPAGGGLERELQSQYAAAAVKRIAGLAASGSCDSLREHRSALVDLSSRDAAFGELCGGLIGRIDVLDSTANGTGHSASGAGVNITSV